MAAPRKIPAILAMIVTEVFKVRIQSCRPNMIPKNAKGGTKATEIAIPAMFSDRCGLNQEYIPAIPAAMAIKKL